MPTENLSFNKETVRQFVLSDLAASLSFYASVLLLP